MATALIDDDGAATYTFDLAWELPGLAERLPFMLQGTTLLHTGSIATMLAPGAADVLAAVEHAHPSATISFDPNCRPSIITDVDYARRQAEKFVTLADIVKASDEDLEWLYPGVDLLDSARRWLSLGGSEGPAMVVVTRGAAGPWGITAAGETEFAAPEVEVADTVGAGDSFMAALLSGVVDRAWTAPRTGRTCGLSGRGPPRAPGPREPRGRRNGVPCRRQPAHPGGTQPIEEAADGYAEVPTI